MQLHGENPHRAIRRVLLRSSTCLRRVRNKGEDHTDSAPRPRLEAFLGFRTFLSRGLILC